MPLNPLVRILVAAAALAAAAPAAHAAPWSAPQRVGPSAVREATLAFPAAGPGLLAWSTADGVQLDRLALLRSDGTLGTTRRVPPFDRLLPLAGGRVALVTQTVTETANDYVTTLRLRVGTPGESFGAGRVLVRGDGVLHGPLVARGPGGRGAVAWSEHVPGSRSSNAFRLRAVMLDGRGRTSAPVTIARILGGVGNASTDVRVAFGRRAELVAVYEKRERRGYGIYSRERSGGRLRAEQRVGPSAGNSVLAVEPGREGRLVTGWSSEDGGEERNRPREYRVAVRPRAGERFRHRRVDVAQQLAFEYPEAIALATDRAGATTFAWSGERSAGEGDVELPVRAVTVSAGGTIGAVRTLAPSGAVAGAARTTGGLVVAWATTTYEAGEGLAREGRLEAAARPSGAEDFGPVESLSPGPADTDVTLATDPRSGRATLLFLDRDGRAHLTARTG